QRSQRVRDRGVEPRSPGWKPGVVPLDQSREEQAEGEGVEPSRLIARPGSGRVPSPIGLSFRVLSSGGRNRTCVNPVNSRVPVPARAPPESNRRVRQSGWPDLNRRFPAPEAGGLARLSYIPSRLVHRTSAQRESNPHVRHGEAVGYRYIMGTFAVPGLSKSREHPVGLETTAPPYRG